MEERRYQRRRGGSLVLPILLIVLGVLFLLDNLNITSGIDWGTIWKLWPVMLIAIGLEVILVRHVSFGAILLVIIIIVIGGTALWWSVATESGDRITERFSWPTDGAERAELELELGVGKLRLTGYADMADLLIADLDLAPNADVRKSIDTNADVARGRISSARSFPWLPFFRGGKMNDWDLRLNSRVRWELDVESGVGDVRLDLTDLRVSVLHLNSGVGAVDMILPRRGAVRATINGGVGDIRVTIPEGAQARLKADRGLGSLTIGSRFKRHGDYYETEGYDRAESAIDLEIDIGVGSVTVR